MVSRLPYRVDDSPDDEQPVAGGDGLAADSLAAGGLVPRAGTALTALGAFGFSVVDKTIMTRVLCVSDSVLGDEGQG